MHGANLKAYDAFEESDRVAALDAAGEGQRAWEEFVGVATRIEELAQDPGS